MTEIDDTKVCDLAYQLWEQDGRPDGKDNDYWHAAEKLLADEGGIADADDPVTGHSGSCGAKDREVTLSAITARTEKHPGMDTMPGCRTRGGRRRVVSSPCARVQADPDERRRHKLVPQPHK